MSSPSLHTTEANSDRERWLQWGRGARTPFPAERTLDSLFSELASLHPHSPALREGMRLWSYAELEAWAARIAQRATAAGVRPGDLVALPATRSPLFVASILGILKAGGAYVPVDLTEPEERQSARRAECNFSAEWSPEGADPEIRFTPQGVGSGGAFAHLQAADRPAYVLYTSGSTGRPKGVLAPHRAITRLVCITDFMEIRTDDVFALHSNLCFDASTLELWAPLLNGASLVIAQTEDVLSPSALGSLIRQHGVTALWLTTSLFAQLAREAPALFASLRTLLFGGEAAQAEAVRAVLQAGRPGRLVNGYGPTETITFAVCHKVTDFDLTRKIPIGRPIANTDAFILDESLEIAGEGELYLGGPGVALGYLGMPELTAERFVQTAYGRLYKTGDAARWNADGTIDFLGRKDRQIKIRGFRIEPGEIESTLLREAPVRHCAVLLRTAPDGNPALVAYYTGEATPAALREIARRVLPSQMVPAVCCKVSELPLTQNGKLHEAALPEPVWRQHTNDGAALPPKTDSEQRIAAAWERVLGFTGIGLDENFFDLGGTSLSLLKLHSELMALRPERVLKIVDLFKHPTVRSFAAFYFGEAEAKPGEKGGTSAPSAAAERAARRRAALGQRMQ